jgi:DNA-directed RNA polymerase subunit RPC12/RpoP
MLPFIVLLPFLVALVVVLSSALRPVACPDCGAPLPALLSPFRKTRRMWREGGYLCARCGCETDTAGRKVTADTQLPPFPARQWAVVGILLLIGAGLAASGMYAGAMPAPLTDAPAPPAVARPEQPPLPVAPPAAPVN